MAGTGWHNLAPKALKLFRKAIVDEPEAFDAAYKALSKVDRSFGDNNRLVSIPRGVEAHDTDRHADAIKPKSLLL
ncbi:DUF2461 family protein [Yoonia sp. SDW83-1]|uniref:DUF2461 family protein n=1 Tax=Yoonia sp. SDW83-1 TaxID=3366945 RepID=UPI00398C8226